MDLTPNIGLGKPLPGENYDIAVFNQNADTIDAAVNTLNLEGTWTNVASQVSVRTDVGSSPIAGTSISLARANKIGKMVTFYGNANIGSTLASPGAIMLPIAYGGTPVNRQLAFGTIFNQGGVAGAMPFTRMNTGKDRLLLIDNTGGFLDFSKNTPVYWFVSYEVA